VIPGLINAHVHLEMSWAASSRRLAAVRGAGFRVWANELMAARREVAASVIRDEGRRRARELVSLGTAGICDVGNGSGPASWMANVGLSGVAQRELLTMDRGALPARMRDVSEVGGVTTRGGAWVEERPSPHALFSTAPELVVACVGQLGFRSPATIHVAEDQEEVRFLREGTGPYAHWLDQMGLDWRWWRPYGVGVAQALDRLGVLGSGLMLVHGVHLDDSEIGLIRARGASLCLCPRSNQNIGGRLPRVTSMMEAGVSLCLGTDSLASSPDLDVLAEIPALHQRWPEVPTARWLEMCTAGAASALRWGHLGRVVQGARPGLVHLPEVNKLDDLGRAAPSVRHWVVPPGLPDSRGPS